MPEKFECGTYVFLFDADRPELGGYYGYPCNKVLFDSILSSTSICSRIYSGDLLLHFLCEQICEVKREGNTTSTSYAVSTDLYITLLTELAQSIKEHHNTIFASDIAVLFAKHNIYCIVLSQLLHLSLMHIDESIRGFKGYIGAFELDKGNPLHFSLFIDLLIEHGFIDQNKIYIQEEYGVDCEEIIPDWVRDNPILEVEIIDAYKYQEQAPPLISTSELSFAGKRFQDIMESKGKKDHYQKIASSLLNNENGDFQYTVNGKLSFNRIIVPKEKLTEYSLNLEHKGSGRSKAELFKKLLGITKKDWRYLAAQLQNGLPDGELCNVRKTQYGIQYHVDIPVKGLNGVSKTVRTAWITKNNVEISLTTAYIPDEKNQQGIAGKDPLIVTHSESSGFWQELYDLAHKEAMKEANKTIPTPMYISGYSDPVMDGMCGFASVIIADARKGFAKWLKNKGIGYHNYKGGWAVSAPSFGQSYEKAKAYAEAFEKVLRQNGIKCHSESRLD